MSSSSSSDDDVFAAAILLSQEEKRKKRRYWVHDLWKHRLEEGQFHLIAGRLMEDEVKFYKYMRMSQKKFNELLEIVSPYMTRRDTKWRSCIGVRERLTVFLR